MESKTSYRLTRNVLLMMLRRESELRLAPETQERYDSCPSGPDQDDVTTSIQRQVLTEFGYDDLNILRAAQQRFPGDPEITETAFWFKYNRCRDGPVVASPAGDTRAPDVPLSLLGSTTATTLHEYAASLPDKGRPLVLVAGSST